MRIASNGELIHKDGLKYYINVEASARKMQLLMSLLQDVAYDLDLRDFYFQHGNGKSEYIAVQV
jgi:hypothetical protein